MHWAPDLITSSEARHRTVPTGVCDKSVGLPTTKLCARCQHAQRMNSQATRGTKSACADSCRPAWPTRAVVRGGKPTQVGLALLYSRGFNRQAEAGCGGFPNAHLRVDSTGRSMMIHKAGHTYPQI